MHGLNFDRATIDYFSQGINTLTATVCFETMGEMRMSMKAEESSPYHQYRDLIENSVGSKKLLQHIDLLLKRTDFIEVIKKLRTKWDIPLLGYKLRSELPPTEWTAEHNEEEYSELSNEIEALCSRCALHASDWRDYFLFYLFYNDFDEQLLSESLQGLCVILDANVPRMDGYGFDISEFDNAIYPISIRISPYASMEQVIRFLIDMNEISFEPLRKKYINPNFALGTERPSRRSERDTFLFENRELPKKELMRLSREQFNSVLDHNDISRIIRKEERQRNKKLPSK